jgi:hypothetical protein
MCWRRHPTRLHAPRTSFNRQAHDPGTLVTNYGMQIGLWTGDGTPGHSIEPVDAYAASMRPSRSAAQR